MEQDQDQVVIWFPGVYLARVEGRYFGWFTSEFDAGIVLRCVQKRFARQRENPPARVPAEV